MDKMISMNVNCSMHELIVSLQSYDFISVRFRILFISSHMISSASDFGFCLQMLFSCSHFCLQMLFSYSHFCLQMLFSCSDFCLQMLFSCSHFCLQMLFHAQTFVYKSYFLQSLTSFCDSSYMGVN